MSLGLGYTEGVLVCSAACDIDTSGCTACGDGVIEAPVEGCDDGNVVDWDGCTGCVASEFQVNTTWIGTQSHPAVAVSSSGYFVVVWDEWTQSGGSTHDVFGQLYDAQGAPVGPEFQANQYDEGAQQMPRVAMDDLGNFLVVWSSDRTSGSTDDAIYGRRYYASGLPVSTEFRIDDGSNQSVEEVDVAMNGAGEALVAWNCYMPALGGNNICAQRYSSTGGAVGGNTNVNNITTGDQNFPAVGLAPDGRGVVVWMGEGIDLFEIYARRISSTGQPQGLDIFVNSTTAESQEYPDIVMAADGSFIVVWESSTSGSTDPEVHGRLFTDAGVATGVEFSIPTSSGSDSRTPRVCSDSLGNFIAVFNHASSDWGKIKGRRFDDLAQPVGPDFEIALTPDFSQRWPACAMTTDGRLIVAFGHASLDGDSIGIFAQRYDANGSPLGLLSW